MTDMVGNEMEWRKHLDSGMASVPVLMKDGMLFVALSSRGCDSLLFRLIGVRVRLHSFEACDRYAYE